jgi:hypothetical protein
MVDDLSRESTVQPALKYTIGHGPQAAMPIVLCFCLHGGKSLAISRHCELFESASTHYL